MGSYRNGCKLKFYDFLTDCLNGRASFRRPAGHFFLDNRFELRYSRRVRETAPANTQFHRGAVLPKHDRRTFLRNLAVASGFVLTSSPTQILGQTQLRSLAPVKVARSRVIREIVGLRPFRPEGFVVEAHRVGPKLLVHNYGHGGAGITLSWGTAEQAVDLVRDFTWPRPTRSRQPAAKRFAVIGCGVNGLSTALMLQRRYQDGPGTVTIYARDLPPDTTSNIAGGFWSPTAVFDDEDVSPKFIDQFRLATKASNRAFQLLVGPEYGVRWIDTFTFHRAEINPQSNLPGGNDLYPDIQIHRDPSRYFGFPYARQYKTMLIEPSIYLRCLLRDFYNAGGKVVVREFRSRDEVMRLPEPVIFNCSGLGSHALFDDKKLIPIRGQLTILLPQPEIDYCYLSSGHMFPRSDGIVLGATFDRDDWSTTVRRDQSDGVLNNHSEIMRGIRSQV